MTAGETSGRGRPTKAELRRRLRSARRDARPGRDVEAESRALAGHVLALVRGRSGVVSPSPVRVAAYASRPTEPPTDRLVEALLAAGHDVLLPVTLEDLDLEWELLRPGVDDPILMGRSAIDTADVVVVPALAVGRDGRRLGQGGGSYDRALARRRPGALLVALLHDGELLEAGGVPHEAHDVAVDVVVTAAGGPVDVG